MARWEIGAGNVGGDQGGQQVFYGGQGVSLPANEGPWRGQPPGTSGRRWPSPHCYILNIIY